MIDLMVLIFWKALEVAMRRPRPELQESALGEPVRRDVFHQTRCYR